MLALTEPAEHGMVGELLATSFRAHGCAGLVSEGGVRDHALLNEMGFPVWARAVHAQGTQKAPGGSVNLQVVCGGQTVRPGDVIVADDDGVCVVPRESAVAVLAAGRARAEKEAVTREHLKAGELSLDYYGFRDRLRDVGVTYVDEASPRVPEPRLEHRERGPVA